MTTREAADAYIAFRKDHDVAEATTKTLAMFSISSQNLVDALGAEILNMNRPDYQEMQKYRNEVLSHFTALNKSSETD
jgi:hypothetical protein